jgi:hypothetical protein
MYHSRRIIAIMTRMDAESVKEIFIANLSNAYNANNAKYMIYVKIICYISIFAVTLAAAKEK